MLLFPYSHKVLAVVLLHLVPWHCAIMPLYIYNDNI